MGAAAARRRQQAGLSISRSTRALLVRISWARSWAQTFLYPSPSQGEPSSTVRMSSVSCRSLQAVLGPRFRAAGSGLTDLCLAAYTVERGNSRTRQVRASPYLRPAEGETVRATASASATTKG